MEQETAAIKWGSYGPPTPPCYNCKSELPVWVSLLIVIGAIFGTVIFIIVGFYIGRFLGCYVNRNPSRQIDRENIHIEL